MTGTMSSDEWNARYAASAGAVWSIEPNAWVAETLGGLSPGTAIDLGAGEGRNSLWLATRGWTVTAVDFSAVGLARGAQREAQLGVTVEWVCADATSWTPSAPVDLVLLSYLHFDADTIRDLLRRAAGWLTPGGSLAVIGHDVQNVADGVGGPQDPSVLYSVEILRSGANELEIDVVGQHLRQVAGAGRPAIDTVLLAHRPARPAPSPVSQSK